MTSPDDDQPASLEEQARDFAEEIASLLKGVLPGAPGIQAVRYRDRFVIRPSGSTNKERGVPLFVNGERLATLNISLQCGLDSSGRWLTVYSSSFALVADLDRTPVLRFDYQRDMYRAPHAHVQVNAHRGALTHLLSKAGHKSPHQMEALHIPVGGSRMRPCLEDLLQFLIVECRFDKKRQWKRHVEAGREKWRRRQVSALVRDVHTDAARVLETLGYKITPPEDLPRESEKALRAW
jgi:hypothetical protein